MKRTIKIRVTSERPEDLLSLMESYSQIYQIHSNWAFQNKTYSKQKAHESLYLDIRRCYTDIPSALIQCARDNALESVKAIKFKRQPKPKRYATIRYDRRTATLRGEQLTISSIGKRQKFILTIPNYFKDILNTWKFTGCTLSYNKKKQFWCHLNFEKESPNKQTGKALGIDLGIHNMAMTSDGDKFSGKEVKAHRRRYLYNRKTLQTKGTPSAKRKLKQLSGKEKRFSQQVNHNISKQLVHLPVCVLVLEDLSKINKKKGKHYNKRISDWSFAQLQKFIFYKAEALGKTVVFVDARYTSQKCNCCGYVSKTNRNKNKFTCIKCGYSEHADVNAAKNIKDNYKLSTQVGRAGCSQSPKCNTSYDVVTSLGSRTQGS